MAEDDPITIADEPALARFADTFDRVPYVWWGILSQDFQNMFMRMEREISAATPHRARTTPQGDRTHPLGYRRYYPGGARMKGDLSISENWSFQLRSHANMPTEKNFIMGEIVNYHPGAVPYIYGTKNAGPNKIEPKYAPPGGRKPKAMANWYAVLVYGAELRFRAWFKGSPARPAGNPAIQQKIADIIGEIGVTKMRGAWVETFDRMSRENQQRGS